MDAGQSVLMVPVREQYVQSEDYSAYVLADADDPCYNRNRAVLEGLEDFDAVKPAKLLATD